MRYAKKYKARKNQDNKTSSPRKILSQQHYEDFNTDDHKSTSSRDVGPGYDDTGMGNGSQTSKRQQKNTSQENNTTEKIRNPRTKRARSRNRQY